MSKNTFPSEVITELGYYVYRLIDPRNGETFYVGKGKGNRVFTHAAGELSDAEDEANEKLKRIREIDIDGFAVQHVIHRHGMDESTAFEVEAALIEAYPSATNIAGGRNNADRGVAHADQIIFRYRAEPADLSLHRIVEITINQQAAKTSVYNAVRFAWRMSTAKAEQAEYVIAVVNGIIVGCFAPELWLPATPQNFPDFDLANNMANRIGFVGKTAPADICAMYERKRVPKRERGAANPIRYWNID